MSYVSEDRYRKLVADMKGGVGWRDLRETDKIRHPSRDVEITGIDCVVVEGNFPWNLIRVETDAGEYGIGEAFPGPASGYVEFLRPGLVGQNPFDLDRLVEHMTQLVSGLGGTAGYAQAAVSGIEIALFDVVGKLTGLPVYQLLGGKYRDTVRMYADCHAGKSLSNAIEANGETYTVDSYAAVARDVLKSGFTAMKFDLDIPMDDTDTANRRLSQREIDTMVEIVRCVREEIGREPVLGFDAHWNYTIESATDIARGIEEYNVSWLEDPVPPDSVQAHGRVAESSTTPILSGENLTRVEGFLPYLTEGALDIIAPDIQKCGGLQEFRKISTLADVFNIPVAPHNISSPVGTVASVHACASVPNAFVLEWHARQVDWWEELTAGEELLIQEGEIAVPEAPGLGVSLNQDVVEAHLAPGEDGFDH
jgi:galactonate dehydratase